MKSGEEFLFLTGPALELFHVWMSEKPAFL